VRFADFEFDLRTGDLRRDGTSLKFQPQPAKVMVLLISRAGEIVTRQDLARQVWGAETFVDFEQGLNFAIRQIRTVLDDDAEQPRFLETLPKRGYRFIAPVERASREEDGIAESRVTNPEADDALEQNQAPEKDNAPATKPRHLRTASILFAGISILLIAVAVNYYVGKESGKKLSVGPIQSIAVLPLANLSADPAQEYFTDGLTDELITELARIGTLRVISRTSVPAYKTAQKRVPEIGRELHVDAVVEGTVERVGNRVRIRAQLIQAATDHHLWAQSYDGNLSDILRLESDVAGDIARQIGYRTSDAHSQLAAQRPISTEAHENYLKGRYRWNQRTEAGLRAGIDHFQKAIEAEPTYAQAYAGLADCYIMLANWGFMPGGEAYPKAETAARKALEIDDRLAEAQTSLAYATFLYDWDWNGAEQKFRHAISLNPNYATAHHFYSIYLMASGRHPEALAEIKRAQELDPFSMIINSVVGWISYEARHYELAIQQCEKAVEMDPSYAPARLDLGVIFLKTGDYQKATAQFERARALAGDEGIVLAYLAQARAYSGDRGEALKILHRLQNPSQSGFVSPWDLALIHVALGDKKNALTYLEKAVDQHGLGGAPGCRSGAGPHSHRAAVRTVEPAHWNPANRSQGTAGCAIFFRIFCEECRVVTPTCDPRSELPPRCQL